MAVQYGFFELPLQRGYWVLRSGAVNPRGCGGNSGSGANGSTRVGFRGLRVPAQAGTADLVDYKSRLLADRTCVCWHAIRRNPASAAADCRILLITRIPQPENCFTARLPRSQRNCAHCRWKAARGRSLGVGAQEFPGDARMPGPGCYLRDKGFSKEVVEQVYAMEDDVLSVEQAA